MNRTNNIFGNFENTKEQLEKIGKAQSDFFSKAINTGMEIQKKQYEFLTHAIQNQVEFTQLFLSSGMAANSELFGEKSKNKK